MKKKIACFVAALFILSSTVIASGAVYTGTGSQTANVSVQNIYATFNNTWASPILAGIVSWNNSSSDVTVSMSSSSANTIQAINDDHPWKTWWGRNDIVADGSTGYIISFSIKLNIDRLAGASCPDFSGYVQSVTAHELGHAFWLDDNPPNTASLMNQDRDKSVIKTPQAYDYANVNAIY